VVQGQCGQKVHKSPSQPMARHCSVCLSSQLHWEASIGGFQPDQAYSNAKQVGKWVKR
jgi:hypothetical protein